MDLSRSNFRRKFKLLLKMIGINKPAGWLWLLILFLVKPSYRPQVRSLLRGKQIRSERFKKFRRKYGGILQVYLGNPERDQKRVFIGGIGFPQVELELVLIKGLELAGYKPIALVEPNQMNLKYYKMAGIKEFLFWSDFTPKINLVDAEAIVKQYHSFEELLRCEYAGARVGKVAITNALRDLRTSSLDIYSVYDRRIIVEYLAASMAAAEASQKMIEHCQPDLAFIYDGVYTPKGELFDVCLTNNIDVIIWESAHKNNTLILKRYGISTRDEHYNSLSLKTWEFLQNIEWTNSKRQMLRQELRISYAKGDWYSSAGTQFDKHCMDAETIRRRLGLDPAKKNAFIFPHIFWDGSFAWGSDLFSNYEKWFTETVKAACLNTQVNWVIKIHPAHIFKKETGYYQDEPLEMCVLRKYIGEIPPHLFVIPAESDISTFSLFTMMDYCLTVRGTIGIEAASFGIPVLTAGTGRYDHKGFTIDSDSTKEYLSRLALIQEIPRLSPEQQERGERFAYGLFLLRPFPLESINFTFQKDYGVENGFAKSQINITTPEDWYKAKDLRAFARWVTESDNPDFLIVPPNTRRFTSPR